MSSRVLLGVVSVVLWLSVGHADDAGSRQDTPAVPVRKLIEFGWDEPDTAFLRQQWPQLEATPFDGCVFHAMAETANGKENFTWLVWGQRAFSPAALAAAKADLVATRPIKLRHNFLRINVTPGDLDWFDDFTAVVANVRLAAHLAASGPCDGLLFDVEQYQAPIFDYRKQRDARTKSWDAYAQQARRRGREVMTAIAAELTRPVILLTFGYTLPWKQSEEGKQPLADVSYGLLAPFLDGMLDAAPAGAVLVDGYELSYGYREPAAFVRARRQIKRDVFPIVAEPQRYAAHMQAGFGIWLDYDWRRRGWNVEQLEKNYFTPAGFETSVAAAWSASDRYVWIYTETPRWWTREQGSQALPPAYGVALRRVKQRAIPPPQD